MERAAAYAFWLASNTSPHSDLKQGNYSALEDAFQAGWDARDEQLPVPVAFTAPGMTREQLEALLEHIDKRIRIRIRQSNPSQQASPSLETDLEFDKRMLLMDFGFDFDS